MSTNDAWSLVGSVPPGDLAEAWLEMHWAAQYLASAGQTFAEPRTDDSHRAMSWDTSHRGLVSAPFAGAYPFRVALRPEDLTLQLLDRTEEPLGSLPLAGRGLEEGYEWLRAGLATYMGGAPPEFGRPEYELPPHHVATGALFSKGLHRERRTVTALYESAAALLTLLISSHDDASPVLCWPHHFDVATLLTIDRDPDGEATKTVGVGLAPTGGGYDSWYWYVTPWPYPPKSALPELTGPGSWHTEGWTGAVLHGDEVVRADASFREAVVRKFVDVGSEAAIASLGS